MAPRLAHFTRSLAASWEFFFGEKAKASCRRRRPLLEPLEDRTVPATFNATPAADSWFGSTLRAAVLSANASHSSSDTIKLAAGGYHLSIGNGVLGQENNALAGDLDILGHIGQKKYTLTIQGGDRSNALNTVIDASQMMDRAFQILGNGTDLEVIFNDLTIQGGLARDDGTAGALPGMTAALGGGVLSRGAKVTFHNVMLQLNAAQGSTGAAGVIAVGPTFHPDGGDGLDASGGAVYISGGTLTVSAAAITNNKAIAGNGGPGAATGAGGRGGVAAAGGVYTSGVPVTFTDSALRLNTAAGGRGGLGGEGDTASDGGKGGLGGGATGGGLQVDSGTATLTSLIVHANEARGGQGGDGGLGDFGGDAGDGGKALGGGVFALASQVTLQQNTDVGANSALGGMGGVGGGAELLSIGTGGSGGLATYSGRGGSGGDAEGGGLFTSATGAALRLLNIKDSRIRDNAAIAGRGAAAGKGADNDNGGFAGFAAAGGNGGASAGGGVFATGLGRGTFSNLDLSRNQATGGNGGRGGLGGFGDTGGDAGPGGAGGASVGGGLYLSADSFTFTGGTVTDNQATGGTGGLGDAGGQGNDGDGGFGGTAGAGGPAQGGGLYVLTSGMLTLTNVPIFSNGAQGGGGGQGGDGMLGVDGDGGFGDPGGAGGNAEGGGLLLVSSGQTTLVGETLVGNSAYGGDGGNGGRGGVGYVSGGNGGDGGRGGSATGGAVFLNGFLATLTGLNVSANLVAGGDGGRGGDGSRGIGDFTGVGGPGGNGGRALGGGLHAQATGVRIDTSTIAFNTVTGGTGGAAGTLGDIGKLVDNRNGGAGGDALGGGISVVRGSLGLTSSTVYWNLNLGGFGGAGGPGDNSDNPDGSGHGGNGGAGQGGGLYLAGADVTFTNATISTNSVLAGSGGDGQGGGNGGAGGASEGGGVYLNQGTFHASTATIAFNTAESSVSGLGASGIAVQASAGGGVRNNGAMANAVNTIFARNAAARDPDFAGTLLVGSHDIIGIWDHSDIPNSLGNFIGTTAHPYDPGIEDHLANNGGPTQTHGLVAGGHAIDRGDDSAASGLFTDQRGFARKVGAHVDIGAVEDQGKNERSARQADRPRDAVSAPVEMPRDLERILEAALAQVVATFLARQPVASPPVDGGDGGIPVPSSEVVFLVPTADRSSGINSTAAGEALAERIIAQRLWVTINNPNLREARGLTAANVRALEAGVMAYLEGLAGLGLFSW